MKIQFVKKIICVLFFLYTGHVYAADPRKGNDIYLQNCQICHGDEGEGVTPDTPDFRFGDNLIKPDRTLFNAIGSGAGMMPAFRGVLSEQNILDVISYLRTLQR